MIKGYQCDYHHCDSWVKTPELYVSSGFMKLEWMGKQYDFCSWDCLLKYGSRFEPVVVVNRDTYF
jgi:hypothetical protein